METFCIPHFSYAGSQPPHAILGSAPDAMVGNSLQLPGKLLGWACILLAPITPSRRKRRNLSGRGHVQTRCNSKSASVSMKTIWFVRHGQAEHNVLYESGQAEACKALLDPVLTDLGRQQASMVAQDQLVKSLLSIPENAPGCLELVVSSPLRRTVQTALGAVKPWIESVAGRRVLLNADLQETGDVRCDTGSPLEELKEYFKDDGGLLNFDELWAGWHLKQGEFVDTGPALRNRLQRFTAWLLARPEKHILVVAHHNLLVILLGVTFLNCEVRQFFLREDGTYEAIMPQVSGTDSELSEIDLKHLKVYDPMVRRKFETWGFDVPDRLR